MVCTDMAASLFGHLAPDPEAGEGPGGPPPTRAPPGTGHTGQLQ